MADLLTSAEANQAISRGQLPTSTEWYEGLMSIVPICLVTLGISALVFLTAENTQSRNHTLLPLLGSVFFAYYMLPNWVSERRLTIVETNKSISQNHQLLLATLSEQGWRIGPANKFSVIAFRGGKWIGISVQVTALIKDRLIYLNLMNNTTIRGRFPFSFGKNARKMRQLITAITNKASCI